MRVASDCQPIARPNPVWVVAGLLRERQRVRLPVGHWVTVSLGGG